MGILGVIMNFKQLFLSIVSVGLFAHSSVLPMGTALGYARVGFSKACTGIHWGIFAAPYLHVSYNRIKEYSPISSKETLEHRRQFVAGPFDYKDRRIKFQAASEDAKKLIKQWDHNNALENTRLHIWRSSVEYANHTFFHYNETPKKQAAILVHPYFVDLIQERKKALKNNNIEGIKKIDAELLKIKPIIQHELSHTQNNDFIVAMIAAPALMPFVTHFGIKGIKKLITATPPRPSILKDIMKIPSAMGKFFLTGTGNILFLKHREQLADNNIESDITNLENMKTFFQEHKELQQRNAIKPLCKEFGHSLEDLQKRPTFYA